MNVHLNGRLKALPSGLTIAQLLEELKIAPAALIVELNGDIVHPETYNKRLLEDDRLEFIRFVGGG